MHTFTIGICNKDGLNESPDVLAARKVANFYKDTIIHHEVLFKQEQLFNNIEETIYQIGSYDQTTIRASTPMWKLTKYIKNNISFIKLDVEHHEYFSLQGMKNPRSLRSFPAFFLQGEGGGVDFRLLLALACAAAEFTAFPGNAANKFLLMVGAGLGNDFVSGALR